MKKTMLTYKTLDRFEAEYKTEQYTEAQIDTIEMAAYIANMNQSAHRDWTVDDIFADFLRILDIDRIETVPAEKEDEKAPNRTAEEITADIIDFFQANEDIFTDAIEELDSYNGYLGDDRYYSMDELGEFYSGTEPSELLRRAYYGYDEETYTTDSSGNKTYGEFNPNREYFRYNGYGNLVSADYKDYSGQLDNYAVESMSENRPYIDSIEHSDELAALFDELEEL